MRNIIVVECKSTGMNYIQDIVDRNYNPIVLEMKPLNDSKEAKRYRKNLLETYEQIQCDFDLIYEKDTYEETLEMVREYDPLLVVPGNEQGVILATRLANDLNLKTNPIENIDAMTIKADMHKRLAENNLRHIRGQVVTTIEEAVEFYERENLTSVVVKPNYGAGSVGVRICMNREEMIENVQELFNMRSFYGNELNDLLIQERIDGEEYVVNTVSCNGRHRITTIWKYHKTKTAEGGQIYDYDTTVNELDLGEANLVEYAYDVADAIGIKYGLVHGEYMIDEKGPVLIEVNCRPMGLSLDAEYVDRISGQHETDSSLDSYLNPEKFEYEMKRGYKLYAHGIVKSLIVPKDIIAVSSPINYISQELKSHYKTSLEFVNQRQEISKTQDLETAGGTLYLVHEDPYQIIKDVNLLRNIEKHAFQLVLSEHNKKTEIDYERMCEDVRYMSENIKGYGTCLLVSDYNFDDVNLPQVEPDKLDEVNGNFDCVVINLNKSIINTNDAKIVSLFLKIFKKVKVGGLIFIPKTTFEFMPNSRLGAEALLKILDLKIELPLHNIPRMIIASKH